MARITRTVSRILPIVGLAALLASTALALEKGTVPYDDPVVPPGQDDLLSTMLGRGAQLPDGCKFAGGGADGPLIRTRYTCPTGEVVYHVVHPDNATDAAAETDQFAIMVESGAPPPTLIDALATLLRNGEGSFEWLWLTSEDEPAASTDENAEPEAAW